MPPAGRYGTALRVIACGPDEVSDGAGDPSSVRMAWDDLRAGLRQRWMWTALALQDIRQRYRGSVLGPFWVTISTLVMAAAMGAIYSRLFGLSVTTYLPYLVLGLIVWQLLAAFMNEGCQSFLSAATIIQEVPLPFSVHAYRTVCRCLIVFAHSLLVVPVGLLVFRIPVGWSVLQVLPALAVLALNGLWIALLLGMTSARFRDVPPIVQTLLQVLFFATPIIWPVDALRDLHLIADLNPAFAAIDVIRAPLLGAVVGPWSWPVLLATTVAGCAATFLIFVRFRARIAYWV